MDDPTETLKGTFEGWYLSARIDQLEEGGR